MQDVFVSTDRSAEDKYEGAGQEEKGGDGSNSVSHG